MALKKVTLTTAKLQYMTTLLYISAANIGNLECGLLKKVSTHD